MQEINLYIAELMIIFAFIYKNLEKEGIVMKRMMKSKILATALCSTVMAGIYASPVMAEKLYYGEVGKSVYVSGKVALREEIKDLKPYPLSRTFLREREKQQFLPEPLLLSFY